MSECGGAHAFDGIPFPGEVAGRKDTVELGHVASPQATALRAVFATVYTECWIRMLARHRSCMSKLAVYLGIDVACAAGKRLPVCVVSAGDRLTPLAIPKDLAAQLPHGVGNREIAAARPFADVAYGVAEAIKNIAQASGWQIRRIAIDAPAAPPETGLRSSEIELAHCRIPCFRTPARPAWASIVQKCKDHLGQGGSGAALPSANRIWMLFGFELFEHLRNALGTEVIEVYPFAIARALLPKPEHKSTEKGYRDQLAAMAARTGWEPANLEAKLKAAVPGNRHDRLDAFMAAWVASLRPEERRAYGDPRNLEDAIWVPSEAAAARKWTPPSAAEAS